MVKDTWKFMLLGLLVAGPAPSLASMATQLQMLPPPAQLRGISVPISLPNLVTGSQRIFLGVVKKVDPATPMVPETRIEFQVLVSFKGKVDTSAPLNLRQSNRVSSSVGVGERVLWFLPKDSPDGFSVPLGFNSGDFRVDGNGAALNLNRNRGLWADDASLWDTGECYRDRFLITLENRNISGATLLSYLRRADSPYVANGSLPFEFLYAALVSCIPELEYRTFLKDLPSESDTEVTSGS